MKKLVVLGIISLVIVSQSLAQCGLFYPAEPGTTYESHFYNKSGSLKGKMLLKVLSVEKNGSALTAPMELTVVSEKGDEYKRTLLPMKCSEGKTRVDMMYVFELFPQFFFAHSKSSFKGNKYYEYPADLKVGQTLNDTVMNLQSENKRGSIQESKMFSIDRRVLSQEKVKTALGEFDAYVVESTISILYYNDKGKGEGVVFNGFVQEWIVPGKGIVKRAIFSGGGAHRLMFYEELVAVRK